MPIHISHPQNWGFWSYIFSDRLRDIYSVGVKNAGFLLTKPVAVITAQLRRLRSLLVMQTPFQWVSQLFLWAFAKNDVETMDHY